MCSIQAHDLRYLDSIMKISLKTQYYLPGIAVPIVMANVVTVSKKPHFGVWRRFEAKNIYNINQKKVSIGIQLIQYFKKKYQFILDEPLQDHSFLQ